MCGKGIQNPRHEVLIDERTAAGLLGARLKTVVVDVVDPVVMEPQLGDVFVLQEVVVVGELRMVEFEIGPFDESRTRALVVSPATFGCPVGLETPAVLSGTLGVDDMSRTVAGAAAPVSPSEACLLASPQPPATARRIIGRTAARRARRARKSLERVMS